MAWNYDRKKFIVQSPLSTLAISLEMLNNLRPSCETTPLKLKLRLSYDPTR
jgi:hypothetical protein